MLKSINKNVVAMWFVSLFTDMASSMITSILPIYVVYILHNWIDTLWYIVAIATFISYVFRILFWYLSDKYKVVKPFVLVWYIISAITKPLMYFVGWWKSIATLRWIERMWKAVRSAAKDTLISAYASKNKTGQTFGFHKMLDVFGEVSGALIVFVVIFYFWYSIYIFKNIFAFTLIPWIMAVFILIFYVKDIPYRKKNKTEFNLKQDYKILPIIFLYLAFMFFMFNDSFFAIKAKKVGYAIAFIPLLVVLLNLTQVFTSYVFWVKIDKIWTSKILIISFILGLLSMFSLYLNFIICWYMLLWLFTVSSLNTMRSYIWENAVNKSTIYWILYWWIALVSSFGAIIIGLIWKNFGEQNSIIYSLSWLTVILSLTLFYTYKTNNFNLILK